MQPFSVRRFLGIAVTSVVFVSVYTLGTVLGQYTFPSPQCPPYYKPIVQACLTNPGPLCSAPGFQKDKETCEADGRFEKLNKDGDFGWASTTSEQTQVILGFAHQTSVCYVWQWCIWSNGKCVADTDSATEEPQVQVKKAFCKDG